MKRIFALMCLTFITVTNAQKVPQKPVKLKGVLVENDYHKNISWIKSKPVPLVSKDFTVGATKVKYIQIYFGMKVEDGKQVITPIRLVNNYKDSDWIFFDEVSYLLGKRKEVRAGKGKTFSIMDKDTNRNVGGGVSEYSDVLLGSEGKAFVKYVLENEETGLNIRYSDTGSNQYREINVPGGTKKLKKHFKTLIDSYNAVNEAYGTNNVF